MKLTRTNLTKIAFRLLRRSVPVGGVRASLAFSVYGNNPFTNKNGRGAGGGKAVYKAFKRI